MAPPTVDRPAVEGPAPPVHMVEPRQQVEQRGLTRTVRTDQRRDRPPLYFQVRELGLLNTRWAIILPLIGLFMPFAVMWMRAHFVTMPADLSEAARMDGATTWQLFWRIHIPLSVPALSSLAILLFLWTWNQFLLAIVLVNDPEQRTMAGALGAFQGRYGTDIPLLCAGSLLILTPTLIIFLIFQRHFVSALLQGSLKG